VAADKKIEVEIAAKATGFEAAFAKISAGAKGAGDNVSSAFSKISGAAAGLGLGLSVAGFAVLIKNSIDAADRLNDLSKATGVAAVTLGGIGFAAQQAGADIDGVAKGFGKLNLKIADALAGNQEALDTFKKLGVTLNDLQTNNAAQIFAKLADTFQSFEDGANKAAGANALFGKTYQSVLPLLDEGGASLQKNIAYYERYSGVTKELVEQSDAFNDELTKLKLLQGAFANQIAASLLPSLQALVGYLVETKEKSGGMKDAVEALIEPLKVLTKVGIAVGGVFASTGNILAAFAASLVALAQGDIERITVILDSVAADQDAIVARTRELIKITDGYDAKRAAARPDDPKRGTRKAPNFGGSGTASKEADEYAKQLERIAKLAAEADLELGAMFSTEPITAAQKALTALTASDAWKKLTGPQQADLTSRLQAIDVTERQTLAWKKDREETEAFIKALKDLELQEAKRAQAFRGTIDAYTLENSLREREIDLVGKSDLARQKLNETIQYEALLKEAKAIGDEAEIARLEDQFKRRIALTEQLAAATEKFARTQEINTIAVNAFADALTSVVTGARSLKDAIKDMERSIVQSISQIAAQNLAKALFGVDNQGGGGIGDIIGKLIGMFASAGSGGISPGAGFGGGGGLGFAANGSDFTSGGPYMVGERGPEIVVPARGSQVIPNHKLGGSNVINITVNQSGQQSTASARQNAVMIGEHVGRAMRKR
jgi:hypothetical protein